MDPSLGTLLLANKRDVRGGHRGGEVPHIAVQSVGLCAQPGGQGPVVIGWTWRGPG